MQTILFLFAKLFLGKGFDKKLPILVGLYKKIFQRYIKEKMVKVYIPLGSSLIVSNKDSALGLYLRLKGEFEPLQTKLFLNSIKKGQTVLDIGANVGYYTVLASKLVGEKGKVYAFEPDLRNFKLLQKNIKLNNCQNVFPYKIGLADQDKIAKLLSDKANPGESRLAVTKDEKAISQKIKITTLNKFASLKRIKRFDVIKIDIEGAEIKALKGAQEALSKIKKVTLFIECNTRALERFSNSYQDLITILNQLGFDIETIINEFDKSAKKYTPKTLQKTLSKVTYITLVAKK